MDEAENRQKNGSQEKTQEKEKRNHLGQLSSSLRSVLVGPHANPVHPTKPARLEFV